MPIHTVKAKSTVTIFGLAVLMALAFCSAAEAEQKPIQALVSKVVDGDTLIIVPTENGKMGVPECIRLACVDAPETAQAYGPNATMYAVKLAEGKTVTVTVICRGYYGRLLAHIKIPYIGDLAEEMVRVGLAWATCKKLRTLQAKAMSKSLGLWAQKKPERPSKYRKRTRK